MKILREIPAPPPHALAAMFPMMAPAELSGLADDVREHGLHEPIMLLDGKVLDGRNRLAACRRAGVTPAFTKFVREQHGDPLAYVISRNLKRRNLSAAQRAALAAELKEQMPPPKRGRPKKGEESSPVSGKAIERCARLCGAGVSAAKALEQVKVDAPEVFALAKAGRVSVVQAQHLSELPPNEARSAMKKIESGTPAREVLRTPQPAEQLQFGARAAELTRALEAHYRRWPPELHSKFVEHLRREADRLAGRHRIGGNTPALPPPPEESPAPSPEAGGGDE